MAITLVKGMQVGQDLDDLHDKFQRFHLINAGNSITVLFFFFFLFLPVLRESGLLHHPLPLHRPHHLPHHGVATGSLLISIFVTIQEWTYAET